MSYILALMCCLVLLTACNSTKKIELDDEVVTYIVPDIVFPTFPPMPQVEIREDGSVNVSEGWIIELAEYKIKMNEALRVYNNIKELYNSEQRLLE